MTATELMEMCDEYGSIRWNGIDWEYQSSDYKISCAMWDKLTDEQKEDFEQYDGTDEEWYEENAPDVWNEVQELAEQEENYSHDVIMMLREKDEQEYEEACAYNRMINREFNKDRI